MNRKSFQHLPAEENPHFSINGKIIYLSLLKKYPTDTVEDCDNILNSLCAALIYLIRDKVGEADYRSILQLIYKDLMDNLISKKN